VGTAIAGETIAAAAPEVAKWAVQQSSDPNTQRILVSAVMNSLADAVSAAGGAALSVGQSAAILNSAGTASAVEQNNLGSADSACC
jgi:hypothetical protein